MSSFGLRNIPSYTPGALGSRTLIDHIFTNDTLTKSYVKSILSDHYAIAIILILVLKIKKQRRGLSMTECLTNQTWIFSSVF